MFLYKDQADYQRYALKKEIFIGRDFQNDIVIQKENISKIHARIYFQNHWYIEDLNSTNGVFLNQKKIGNLG